MSESIDLESASFLGSATASGDEAVTKALDGKFPLPRRKQKVQTESPYPYAPSRPLMLEMYGPPPPEGSPSYKSALMVISQDGPEVYGGRVKRNEQTGEVIEFMGRPAYAGGGYPPVIIALTDPERLLKPFLHRFPDLVNDRCTGCAQPLHMAAMTRVTQYSAEFLCDHGADVEALDANGMTPLQKMAANNLPVGVRALLLAGADMNYRGKTGFTPTQQAERNGAAAALEVLRDAERNADWLQVYRNEKILYLKVNYAGHVEVNGTYLPQDPTSVPMAFTIFCRSENWDAKTMWLKWNQDPWYKNSENDCYIYRNASDRQWWIDSAIGMGLYSVSGPAHAPPAHGWEMLQRAANTRAPMVRTFREKRKKVIEIKRPPKRPALKDL
ncbi:unnamed protein product [Amoebophrya sp. A120]|nr:unnamed protein product [Amoebophrya sp. A120]|eukprot:GSA120T00019090001.1